MSIPVDTGQLLTLLEGMDPTTPVILQASTALLAIQAANTGTATPLTRIDTTLDPTGIAPVDLSTY